MTLAGGARGHRTTSHTADAGLEAWAPSLAEAYEEIGMGLFELMVDPGTIVEREARRLTVRGDDAGDLLVRWITELLYLVDAQGMVFGRLAVERVGERELVATAYGERLDPLRHRPMTAVKAATYHQLMVDPGPPARVRVILDV